MVIGFYCNCGKVGIVLVDDNIGIFIFIDDGVCVGRVDVLVVV